MTDRAELERLQSKAHKAGRVARFTLGPGGYVDSVFYQDAKGPGLQREGLALSPIAFAERERAKPAWHETPESWARSHPKPRRFFCA